CEAVGAIIGAPLSSTVTCEIGSGMVMRVIPTGQPIPICPPQPVDAAMDLYVCQPTSGSIAMRILPATDPAPICSPIASTPGVLVVTSPTPGAIVMRYEP